MEFIIKMAAENDMHYKQGARCFVPAQNRFFFLNVRSID
jgi:hypothetical protein